MVFTCSRKHFDQLFQVKHTVLTMHLNVFKWDIREGVNLAHLLHFIEALLSARSLTRDAPSIDQKEIGAILSLAQSDRERELIKYTAFKASALTATAAKRHLGFHNMTERCDKVQACIEEAQNKLSHVHDRALLLSMGFSNLSSSESDTGSEIGDILVSSPGFSPNHTASVSMHSRSFLSSPSFPPVSSGGGPSPLSLPPDGRDSGPSPHSLPPDGSGGGPSPLSLPPDGSGGGPSPLSLPPDGSGGGPSPLSLPPDGSGGGPSQLSPPPYGSGGGPSPLSLPPDGRGGGPSPLSHLQDSSDGSGNQHYGISNVYATLKDAHYNWFEVQ